MSQSATIHTYEELLALLKLGKRVRAIIIPDVADEIVARQNTVNREIRKQHIREIGHILKTKQWNPDFSEPLMFHPDNQLADGQHRMLAVQRTRLPMEVDILPNVTSILGHGEGRLNRTLADYLGTRGLKKGEPAQSAASITRALFKLAHPKVEAVTNAEYLDFFETERSFIVECFTVATGMLEEVSVKGNRIFKPQELAMIRARAIRQYRIDVNAVDAFYRDAVLGVGPDGTWPAQLYEGYNSRTKRNPLTPQAKIDTAIAALEYHLKGKKGRLENIRLPKPPPPKE